MWMTDGVLGENNNNNNNNIFLQFQCIKPFHIDGTSNFPHYFCQAEPPPLTWQRTPAISSFN